MTYLLNYIFIILPILWVIYAILKQKESQKNTQPPEEKRNFTRKEKRFFAKNTNKSLFRQYYDSDVRRNKRNQHTKSEFRTI